MAMRGSPFSLLAEPRKARILSLLSASGPQTPTALAKALGLPLPAVSQHLRLLLAAGLVEREKRGRHSLYSSSPSGIAAATRALSSFLPRPPAHLSARNQIWATVLEVVPGDLVAKVVLATEPGEMVALVTSDAARELSLSPGDRVRAVVKATNVMVMK